MSPRNELDQIARQFPLGTCVHDLETNRWGWIVGWTLWSSLPWVNIVSKGWPIYTCPETLVKVSRAEVDSANRRAS